MFLFIIITSLFIASCEKSNERCENSHCDVLTCKIDGVSWAPYCESSGLFGCSSIDGNQYRDLDSEYVNIRGWNDLTNESFQIFVFLVNLTYPEKENRISPENVFWDGNNLMCGSFNLDTTRSQQFIISSFDYENRIFEGTFYFSAKNECDSTHIVTITDGYFNVSY